MLIYRNILFTHNFHKSTTKHAIGLEIMGGRGRGRGRGRVAMFFRAQWTQYHVPLKQSGPGK